MLADYNHSYDLPADVFTEGEVRPTRTTKKKAAKKTMPTQPQTLASQAINKRKGSTAGLDVRDASEGSAVKRRHLITLHPIATCLEN